MWILFALGASIFWGLSYVFSEQIYEKISVLTSLGLTSAIVAVFSLCVSYFSNTLKSDIHTLTSSRTLMFYFAGGAVALIAAEIFIGFSISFKSATLAGLIEISYPIFIALFSYILFKHQVTLSTIIGGIVVFIGIFIIYFFNK